MFMLLMPKRVKYRKTQRGRMKGKAYRGCDLLHGEVALQTTEPCWITDRQIEAARIAINRYIKRGGKLWIRIFPDKSQRNLQKLVWVQEKVHLITGLLL